MARFEDHIAQAKRNLKFLESINSLGSNYFDWQVTASFYTALHLVNAHLSKYNLQYRKHKDVNHALNFYNSLSPARLPENEYISYTALQSLSRRSRYLVSEKDNQLSGDRAFFTYDKHLARSARHLNTILLHFSALLQVNFESIDIRCDELKRDELKFIRKV